MADIPFYLQGSQTGSILQGAQQPLPSSIPSIGGQQSYVPGAGMAPYASGGIPSQYDAIMASTNPEHKAIQDALRRQYGGTLSVVPSVPQSAAPTPAQSPAPQGGTGFTAIGQSTFGDDLRAANAAYNPFPSAPQKPIGTGGSGGGAARAGSSGGQTAGSGGGLLSNLPQGSSQMPSVTGTGSYAGGNLNYAQPGMQGAQGGAAANPLVMQQGNPQSGLDMYRQSAGYQLLNAPGAYQASPGYQYAVDQAMGQVQRNAAGRGLLESGAVLRGMQDRAQGMAMQDYGNWWNRQNQQFTDYQNRLAGLAGGNVGGDMAYNLGQAQAGANMQTGGNLGSLFSGQGAAGYGGLVNTGAAQSGNINTAGAQQAQVNSANQGTMLAGAVYNRGLF